MVRGQKKNLLISLTRCCSSFHIISTECCSADPEKKHIMLVPQVLYTSFYLAGSHGTLSFQFRSDTNDSDDSMGSYDGGLAATFKT